MADVARKKTIDKLYQRLLERYGPQGWWPIDTKYHPGDYAYPKTKGQRFEICMGAILTQNTSWKNVEIALRNLKKRGLIDARKMTITDDETIKSCIRPSGYFNQKTKKIKIFSEFYLTHKEKTPRREELLNLWGIGKETADSILLYAYQEPIFVVDAYTKRVFAHHGIATHDASYDVIQKKVMDRLPDDYKVFNEFHALLVEHAKRHYQKRPYVDPLFRR